MCFLFIAIAVGTLGVTYELFYDYLIDSLNYEVSAAPAYLKWVAVALVILFWFMVLYVWEIMERRKINRRKRKFLGSDPAALSPADFERFVGLWFEQHGYRDVKIVGQSGDYGADVLATDPEGRRVAVQCKRYKGSTGIRAAQEVLGACSYYGCGYGIVVATGHFTRQVREFAQKSGILLYQWDGNKFIST